MYASDEKRQKSRHSQSADETYRSKPIENNDYWCCISAVNLDFVDIVLILWSSHG